MPFKLRRGEEKKDRKLLICLTEICYILEMHKDFSIKSLVYGTGSPESCVLYASF